jgi:hypothetical protein
MEDLTIFLSEPGISYGYDFETYFEEQKIIIYNYKNKKILMSKSDESINVI